MVVLIVDDEPSVAGTLASVFRRSGYRSYWVSGAVKAFLLAQQINPDLLLTDVMMPGFSGIDLAIRFRSEFPDCKILLMSGQAETDDLLERAKEQGYDFQVVAKPIWPPDLLAVAEKVLGVPPKSKQANARGQSAQSTTKH